MSSWFDDFEQKPPTADEDDVFADGGEDIEEETPKRARGGAITVDRSTIVVIGAVVLATVVAVLALVYLMNRSGADDSVADGAAETDTVQQTTVNQDEQVAVAGQCEPEEDETTLSTGDTSLRGVVAKWQGKYYDRDTSLTEYLTEGSWLHDQDWEEVLAEGAPEGSSWCAVMAPVKENSVDVDVMVTFADNSSQVYQQTVIGKQDTDGTWRIDDIEIR